MSNLLLVDDHQPTREYLKQYLASKGYQIYEAESSTSALDWILKVPMDIAVVDMRLNGEQQRGLDILSSIKQHNSHTMVIMTTAYAPASNPKTRVMMDQAERRGADAFIEKSYKDLGLKIVNAIKEIERKKTLQSEQVQDGALPVIADKLNQPNSSVIHAVPVSQPGIPAHINKQLQKVLSNCGPFRNNDEVSAVFIDSRISLWHDDVPQANSPRKRIKGIIEYLYNKYNHKGENALVLFLHVVKDDMAQDDMCYAQLSDLIQKLVALCMHEDR